MTTKLHKWLWMMDWCKKHGLAAANNEYWKKAENAYHAIPFHQRWTRKA